MKGHQYRTALIATAVLVTCTSLGMAGLAGRNLYYNGKVVSSGVISHNGIAYVPLKDIASAFSLTMQPRNDGFALVRAGGGTQMEGLTGKIGDDLFSGQVRLKVSEVVRGSTYARRYSKGDDLVAADGKDIVAVIVRLKNGTQKPLVINVLGNPTSITDQDSHAYEPFSGLYADHPGVSNLLPGAAVDLALTFTVPKDTMLKDLVYTADTVPSKAGQVFRVSLSNQ